MLIRLLLLLFIVCSACRSGIIPCPDPEVARLKKSSFKKRVRLRDQPEPMITVSSDAKTPKRQSAKSRRVRYVQYEIEHVDVEELDCPRPGEKKVLPKKVRNNIRKNRRKMRYYYVESETDTTAFTTSATSTRR